MGHSKRVFEEERTPKELIHINAVLASISMELNKLHESMKDYSEACNSIGDCIKIVEKYMINNTDNY